MFKNLFETVHKRLKIKWIIRRINILKEFFDGKDFSSTISQESLGFSSSRINLGSPSSKKSLKKAFQEIVVTDKDKILDIGCAKGYAIKFLLELPFLKVDGLEISSALVEICKKNFQNEKKGRTKIYNTDALDFDGYGEYNFFYLYNPFPSADILKSVIKKILFHSKSKIYIIYNNAKNNEIFSELGFDVYKKIKDPASPKKDIIIFFKQ